ncbi:MAG: hypothetical protein IPK58_17725 [Acidobacteria bacterium]|nr:hypothetical protein [Acidobacteriota bacterium]
MSRYVSDRFGDREVTIAAAGPPQEQRDECQNQKTVIVPLKLGNLVEIRDAKMLEGDQKK